MSDRIDDSTIEQLSREERDAVAVIVRSLVSQLDSSQVHSLRENALEDT